MLLSLKVAGWATAIDVVLGVAVAFGLSRWRSSARELVDSLLTLPLVMLKMPFEFSGPQLALLPAKPKA